MKLRYLLPSIAVLLSIGAAGNLSAGEGEPQIRREAVSMRGDRAAGLMRVVIPSSASDANPLPDETPVPPDELDPALPPLEDIPEPQPEVPEDPPPFFGEPISGSFIWVLDRSGSMGARDQGSGPIEDENGNTVSQPSRIQVVKAECIKVLRQVKEDDHFAIVTFASSVSNFASLVEGTPSNVADAIQMISSMYPSGATAAHDALQIACNNYGNEIDKLFFLSDGAPNVTGTSAQILQNFPGWFQAKKDGGCSLVCVHIGNDGYAAQFMQSLASQNGGTYIHK